MAERERSGIRALVSSVLFVAIAFVFLMLCTGKMRSLSAGNADLDAQILALEEAIEDEKKAQLDVRVEQAYYQSDAYKEKYAREQFNLIYPGETLYVIK